MERSRAASEPSVQSSAENRLRLAKLTSYAIGIRDKLLPEVHVTLVLDEGGLPRDILRMCSQVHIELAVRGTIKRHTLDLTVLVTFIGVEESESRNVSEQDHTRMYLR